MPAAQTKSKYTKLIAEHDKVLHELREEWINAPASRKESWIQKIDVALEERIPLMILRDGKPRD